MTVYYAPKMKWQYSFLVVINDYEYQFGDRSPMYPTLESAQAIMTFAVESHEHIPVNILGSLQGEFISDHQFVGQVNYADDLPDGSDFDPDTERMVEVTITCTQHRHNTVLDDD